MDDSRLIRSELAYWNDDKTEVELYENFVRFLPVGDKVIEIRYGNIVSCKRYMKEVLITSKGSTEDGYYDIHYIPLKFEHKDTAEFFYEFRAGCVCNEYIVSFCLFLPPVVIQFFLQERVRLKSELYSIFVLVCHF